MFMILYNSSGAVVFCWSDFHVSLDTYYVLASVCAGRLHLLWDGVFLWQLEEGLTNKVCPYH